YTYNNFEVLARSKHKQESCYKVNDIFILDGRIKAAMTRMDHGLAKKPHRYAWRHVATRRSVCVIGYEPAGKTWSYLPWLCHSALKHFEKGFVGACCIILCLDAKHSEQIAAWCNKLLNKKDKEKGPTVMRLFQEDKLQMVVVQLKDNCGILLTSVDMLLLLCNGEHGIMDSKTISCIALENINELWNQDRKECEQLIDWLLKHLTIGVSSTQFMISGRQWCEAVMNRLLPKLNDVLLLFTDALEATVYGNIKHELLFLDPQLCEVEIIKALLAKNLEKERVVMACASNNDANALKIHLISAGIRSIIINEGNQKHTFQNWCHEDKRNVLIAVDEVIPKLRGVRIDCLFHYTPASNWRRFKTRFSLLYGSYEPQAVKYTSKSTTSSIICITQKDTDLIWSMCNFLLKHDITVPPAWLTAFNEIRIAAERLNPIPKESMCCQMLCYGNCWLRKCQYRHELSQNDQKRPVQCFDDLTIKFYISYVSEAYNFTSPRLNNGNVFFFQIHSPTRFVVKNTSLPISHLASGIPITKLESSINMYYLDASNRKQHLDPKLNDICVAQLNNRYQRVVVTRVGNEYLEIRQLDNVMGVLHVKPSKLLVCNEQFIYDPPQCQELCLAGIVACNMERVWSDEAKKLVLNGFFKERHTNRMCVFNADVNFDFDDKYFVRNIYDSHGNDLKSFLFKNIPVLNDEQVLSRLQKLI
ncbi:hypothetical protein KR093_008068, partial [Drosophila rubida]